MASHENDITCDRRIKPRRPILPLVEFATVDADHQSVAILTTLGSVFVHHIPTEQTKRVALRQKRVETVLAIANGFVAVCNTDTMELHFMNTEAKISQLQGSEPMFSSDPRVCSLSANAEFFGVVSKDTTTGLRTATVFNRSDWNTPHQTWDEHDYEYINFSPDGTTTFLLAGRHLIAFDTLKGSHRASLPIDRYGKYKRNFGVAANQSVDRVAVADGTSLRIWNINNTDAPVKTMSAYQSPRSRSVAACAISQDGSRVVAALPKRKIGVWDTTTCSHIATFVGHDNKLYACDITSDGTSILSVDELFEIRTWQIPVDDHAQPASAASSDSSSDFGETQIRKIATNPVQPEVQVEKVFSMPTSAIVSTHSTTTISVLEHAFAKILSDPSLLDQSFIIDHISAVNVKSASDLLAGHNIILFAIRAGVITRSNIHTIADSRWYLQDNLYLPASKLTAENGDLLDAVFHHAESLGILKDGYCFKMAREIRKDLQKDLRSVGQAVSDMAQRLCDLEQRVGGVETDMQDVHNRINKIAVNEQKLQDAVKGLSDALKQLQNSNRKDDKRAMYAAVAKCLLSFIPLVGQAVGEVAVTAAELLMNFNKRDVMPDELQRTKSILTQITQVDLSNVQVARYAFSGKALDKLALPTRNAVLQSVLESGFESVDAVESMLIELVRDITASDEPVALLDIGDSAWLSEPGGATSAASSSQGIDSLDKEAQKYFQYVCLNKGEQELSIEETKLELNRVLERCNGLHGIDEDTVENMFFEIADEDAEMVSEGIFVEMFRRVREDQEEQNAMRALIDECRMRFRKRADPKAYLSMRMAARLLCNVDKEMTDRGIWAVRKCVDVERAVQLLKSADDDGVVTVDEGVFICAIEAMIKISE